MWTLNEPIEETLPLDIFEKHIESFEYLGGDIENFLMICKMQYSLDSLLMMY